MALEFNIGDRVVYKDIGGKRNLIGTVTEVVRDSKGNIEGYTIKIDDGSFLACSIGELNRLPE